jgi:putative flippase GtrA
MNRVSRFTLVSAAGAAIQLALIAVLSRATSWPSGALALIAVTMAILHNFAWHWTWTWRDRGTNPWPTFVQFVGANGLVSLAGNFVITGELARLGMPLVAANAVAIVSCGVMNYGLADRIVFGRPGLKTRPSSSAQSARSAASGSTREARQAGAALATHETTTTATVAVTSVAGS